MKRLRESLIGLLIVGTAGAIVLLGILAALGDAALEANDQRSDCRPPAGWVLSPAIAPGETLPSLASQHDISEGELRKANCLPAGPISLSGRQIYLPSDL